jgi:hypothetical protein
MFIEELVNAGVDAQADAPFSHLLEIFVHELNGHRAFADGGGDALDRVGSDISRREYA